MKNPVSGCSYLAGLHAAGLVQAGHECGQDNDREYP